MSAPTLKAAGTHPYRKIEVVSKKATPGDVTADDSPRPADPFAFLIARVVLLASLICAPWAFGAVDSWAWMSLGLVSCLVLLLWTVGSIQQQPPRFFWTPLYIPLTLFLILGLLQYGARLAVDRWETRTALVLLASNLTFFFVSSQLFAGVRRTTWRRLGLTILMFAAVMGLFSILQFASGAQKIFWIFDTGGNFFGPYGNPDHYAGLMEMLIPVGAFYILQRRESAAALALSAFALMIAVASMMLAGSRSGLFALSAEIVIALTLSAWRAPSLNSDLKQSSLRRSPQTKIRRPSLRIGTAVAAITLAAALLFSWLDTGYVSKRLSEVASPGDAWTAWAGFRKSVVLDSFRMLRAHTAFGVGLGNFEIAYPRFQSYPTDLTVEYAHNDYAQAIAETGLVGTALILMALALFSRRAFQDWGRRMASGDNWMAMGAAVGCCGLLVHSFFDFNLHVPANAAWFAVLAGLAITPSTHA